MTTRRKSPTIALLPKAKLLRVTADPTVTRFVNYSINKPLIEPNTSSCFNTLSPAPQLFCSAGF